MHTLLSSFQGFSGPGRSTQPRSAQTLATPICPDAPQKATSPARQLVRILAGLLLVSVGGFWGSSPANLHAADQEEVPIEFRKPEFRVDTTGWEHLPVYHNGRRQPLDSFARQQVERIYGRQSPTLEWRREDGEVVKRKFTASELLLSWLAQPEIWQEFPFLPVPPQVPELHEKILDIDLNDRHGRPVTFVSPADVETAEEWNRQAAEIDRKARSEKETLTPVERATNKLTQALFAYIACEFSPILDDVAENHHLEAQRETLTRLNRLRSFLERMRLDPETQPACVDLAIHYAAIRVGSQEAQKLAVKRFARTPKVAESYGQVVIHADALARDLQRLAVALDQPESLLSQANPDAQVPDSATPGTPESLLEGTLEQRLHTAAVKIAADPEYRKLTEEAAQTAKEVARLAHRARAALHDNSRPLCVVPSLNGPAFERKRPQGETAKPWLDLQTLILAPDWYFETKGYPVARVRRVQDHFRSLLVAYREGDASAAERACRDFGSSLQRLAGDIERKMVTLPSVKEFDEELLGYIAYPESGWTKMEVYYNRLDPFKWSWILSFAAMVAFALAFGAARALMVWTGIFLLVGTIAVSCYGFGLRVAITQFAPVTNMYETMIYVGSFVSLLGLWFLTAPLTWESIKLGWKLAAVPGTPEDQPLAEDETEVVSQQTATLFSFVLLVFRLLLVALVFWGLAIAKYDASGGAVLRVLPQTSTINGNDLLVWLVSLGVLAASMWCVPRAVLALLVGTILMPRSWWVHGRTQLPKLYEHPRPLFGLAAALAGFLSAFVAWWTSVGLTYWFQTADPTSVSEGFKPLQPILRDNFWLTIHVLTIVSSYGAGALAWGLGNLSLGYYLLGRYRHPILHTSETHRPSGDLNATMLLGRRPPESAITLAGYVYKVIQVSVLLLIAGTILGGLWADVSWGRFWGWDPKEVWALISALVYLAILHGRYAGWFGNFGLAAGSVFGFSAIVMSWYGVNFWLGAGLHAYATGTGGFWWVAGLVVANWLFVVSALIRYLIETTPGPLGPTSNEAFESNQTSTLSQRD